MSTKTNDNGNIHHNNRSSVVFKDDFIEHLEILLKPGAHLLPNLESIVATSDGESTDSNDSNNSKDSKKISNKIPQIQTLVHPKNKKYLNM